jgi:lipopolysaccharide/colanic/teichoic acid biosynthesis glycosyltransferase
MGQQLSIRFEMCETDCRHSAPSGAIGVSSSLAVSDRAYWFAKRAGDVVVSLAVILVCLPVCLVIAIAIKLDSRGPIFFAQERAGRDRASFRMLKFRSMSSYAERRRGHLGNPGGGPVFKMWNDPRVTRVGRFLRQWSLDELPQFLNVLLGHMSLVGPRPLPMSDVTNRDPLPGGMSRETVDEWLALRHTVPPGITGLWQVNGRSLLGLQEWIRYDLEYVNRRGIPLDLKILIKTPFAVLSGNGAV